MLKMYVASLITILGMGFFKMYKKGNIYWQKIYDIWWQKIYINGMGMPIYTYHYKRKASKPCIIFEINTDVSKKFCGYTLIEKDVRDILIFLEEFHKISNLPDYSNKKIVLKGWIRSIIITYGKCFVQADERRTKLDETYFSVKYKDHHDFLMNMRHEYVAHGGKSIHEECKLILHLPPYKKYLKRSIINPKFSTELHQTIYSENFYEETKFLVEEIHIRVKEKLNKLYEVIRKRMLEISPRDYYDLSHKLSIDRIVLKENDVLVLQNHHKLNSAKK